MLTAAMLAVGALTFQAPVALTLSRQGLAVVLSALADFNRDGTAGVVIGNLGTPPSAFCRLCVEDFRAG